jgi:hypothetical protein
VVSEEGPPASSRRELLRSSRPLALAGFAAALAGCGSSRSGSTTTTTTEASASSDVEHLNRLLDLEYFVSAAYTAATPLLRGRQHAAAKIFLGQELAHISSLITLIRRADGQPHQPQASYDLGHPRGSRELLTLLDRAERVSIAGYLELLPRISIGTARSTLASILANDAQHVSVLRIALGRDPAPAPLLTAHE